MSTCVKCSKIVGMVEERKACGKVFHVDCFVCGGLNSDGCGKKLTLDKYTQHDNQPYCTTCYAKLFAPKGFMGGSLTHNTFLEEGVPPDSTTNDRHHRVADTDEYLKKANENPSTVSSVTATISAGSASITCVKCSKTVGLVEQRLACNRTWHADCFTCGGLSSDGCSKKLTLDNYKQHDKDPYCTPCYNKLFGTKGFIGGSGMNNFVEELPPDIIKNDRNTRAIDTEALPTSGGVKAAREALKQALPNA